MIVHGDGTVTDERTGLVWQQSDRPRATWAEAMASSALPWRLPTVAELVSLVDYGRREPAIDSATFACAQERYWTATRCQCNYPYVGDTCGKKRFEAVKKKLKEESSSSSSSSETSSSESSDESESSDSDDSAETSESSDSSSSSSDLSSSSDSEEDSWGGNEDHHDRRHRETHEWSGWLMGIVFLVLICCCIGGLFWFMWRPTRVVKISGRA